MGPKVNSRVMLAWVSNRHGLPLPGPVADCYVVRAAHHTVVLIKSITGAMEFWRRDQMPGWVFMILRGLASDDRLTVKIRESRLRLLRAAGVVKEQ